MGFTKHECFAYFIILFHAILLLSSTVHCDESDDLLQGINSYRTSLRLQPLTKNKNAGCLADKIADKLQDKPCSATLLGPNPQVSGYQGMLTKCGIGVNHTTDGAILPVCVHKLVPTLLLTNYTRTPYGKYVNDSKYTGVGLGHENDWMVMVLTTDTVGGTFAGSSRLVSNGCLMYLVLSLFLYFA
ncbi:hypothetical protein ACFE04_028670 [Oxalis oulophora]